MPTMMYKFYMTEHSVKSSAYVLLHHYRTDLNAVTFTTLSGDLVVKRQDDLLEMSFPAYDLQKVDITDQLISELGVRPLEAYMGRDLLCILPDENQVQQFVPDLEKIQELDGLLLHLSAKGKDFDCISRSFAPKLAIEEDPVCVSSHCHIAPYWSSRLQKEELVAYQVSQRGGNLYYRVENDKVYLSGKAALFSIADLYI